MVCGAKSIPREEMPRMFANAPVVMGNVPMFDAPGRGVSEFVMGERVYEISPFRRRTGLSRYDVRIRMNGFPLIGDYTTPRLC